MVVRASGLWRETKSEREVWEREEYTNRLLWGLGNKGEREQRAERRKNKMELPQQAERGALTDTHKSCQSDSLLVVIS